MTLHTLTQNQVRDTNTILSLVGPEFMRSHGYTAVRLDYILEHHAAESAISTRKFEREERTGLYFDELHLLTGLRRELPVSIPIIQDYGRIDNVCQNSITYTFEHLFGLPGSRTSHIQGLTRLKKGRIKGISLYSVILTHLPDDGFEGMEGLENLQLRIAGDCAYLPAALLELPKLARLRLHTDPGPHLIDDDDVYQRLDEQGKIARRIVQ